MIQRFCLALLFLVVNCAYSQNSFNREELIHDLKILSADSLEGRKTGLEGNRKARAYIISKLNKIGIQPFSSDDFVQSFTIPQTFGMVGNGNGANILAVIEGKKNSTIVISAHYDHVGVIRNVIYNGADDNASGVSALLAIAEYFFKNPPSHRMIIAFFDAEEIGLKGSAHFVNTVDLKNENIVFNLNMDMISRSDKNELYACGSFYHPELKTHLNNLSLPHNIKLLFGHDDPSTGRNDWTNQSDQRNFQAKNIPFLYFGVEDHADYHKPTDTFEKIDLDFFSSSTETILRAVKALDRSLQ